MKFICLALFLVGCAGASPAQDSAPPCQNITQETWAGVPYSWDVMDDEETTKMDNGCTFTTITHYVLYTDNGGGGAGGSGPDPFHCDVDACGGPNDKRITYSDPADALNVLNAVNLNTSSSIH